MNRWLSVLCLGVAMSATGLVGCGDDSEETEDDGGGSGQQAEVNQQVAASLVQSSTSALSSLSTGDGASAGFALAGLGMSAWTVITPAGQSGGQALPAGSLGSARSAICEDACDVAEDGLSGSCNFDGCSSSDFGVTWGMNGTMSWTQSTVQMDLELTGSQESTSTEYSMKVVADLAFSSTTLDGSVSTSGESSSSAGGQNVTVTWDTSIVYNDIVFPEGGGCPTSGSVDLDASVTANGQSYEGSGNVAFPNEFCQN